MRLRESSRRAEPTVVAPSPHIHCNAPRRCEQIATYDVIGAEAGWADFQYPVAGGEPWSDSVTHEPVERTRARFGAAIGTETVARRNAVGLETGHRPRANPADRFRGGRDAGSRAGSGPSRCARRLHTGNHVRASLQFCQLSAFQWPAGSETIRTSSLDVRCCRNGGGHRNLPSRSACPRHVRDPPATGDWSRTESPASDRVPGASLVVSPNSSACPALRTVGPGAGGVRETGNRYTPPDAARLLLRCNNLTDPVAN